MHCRNKVFALCLFACVVFLFSSCSTKKKTWFHRQYHNTTAKYNGYFNGNESIKYGIKKITDDFVDDYSTILPIFKTGNLKESKKAHPYMDKAIQKGSVVIQKHSIKIRGKEYCKWIDDNYFMVGKAYFYKGEFDEAIKTFVFIADEYKKSFISYDALLWLSRCYLEKGDFASSEAVLIDLKNNRKFPEELEKDYEIITADLCLRQGNLPLAKSAILNCLKKHKVGKDKARLNFILAQIYQLEEQYGRASHHYEKVLKSNADYSMVFNTKMNLALCSDKSSKDSEKMRKQLIKMTKDDKNKEYLDQIYYTIAEMDVLSEDTSLAIENYLNSTLYSVSNDPQKALSFLALGNIEYARSNYVSSQLYFDSTIYFMEENYRLYSSAYKKYLVLTDLVENLNTIELQDSLIALALLPRAELNAVIKKIIDEEIARENLEREQEILKRKTLSEGNMYGNRNEQFGNNTSGGKWYFYNPATLSFGLSEFTKKWGKRKLEDDWRRKNKKSTKLSLEDSTSADKKIVQNTKDPQFYLSQIPTSAEDFRLAREKIANSCYQAAIIYKYDLFELQKSNMMLDKILKIVDVDSSFVPLSYYNLYLNYGEQGLSEKSSEIKSVLLNDFSESVFTQIILDPNYLQTIKSQSSVDNIAYEEIYNSFSDKKYNEILSSPTEFVSGDLKNKTVFLKAIGLLAQRDTSGALSLLGQVKRGENKDLSNYANTLIEILNDPSSLIEANREAVEKTPYTYSEDSPHFVVLVLPRNGVDISFLKTLVSDYNTTSHSTEVFEISAMLMGLDHHILMVKSFVNASSAMNYYNDIPYYGKIIKELEKTDYSILSISEGNFQEFYINKDIKGYGDFFTNKYLNEN